MKTLFKNFKTVAAIFLALVIYSCDDELIEQQDVSNTNQEFSRKPIKFCGNFLEGGYDVNKENLLLSEISGNSSSHNFTTQWQTDEPVWGKDVLIVTDDDDDANTYRPSKHVGFHVYKKAGKIIGFQIFLKDDNYRFATDNTPLTTFNNFPVVTSETTNVVIEINTEVELFRYLGKGNRRISVGYIYIGNLEYELNNPDCDCWDPDPCAS